MAKQNARKNKLKRKLQKRRKSIKAYFKDKKENDGHTHSSH
jgi:hypothetical protein